MNKPQIITIATRESPLALWQAHYAAELIERKFPDIKTQLLPMTTKGDQILNVTLNKIGGKGLFLKELEQSLLAGQADIAVHSMKDVPADMPEPFVICNIFARHDASDAFVSSKYKNIDALPIGAKVGTSSLRRQSQLLARRPDLCVLPLRGNVQTRLQKLDNNDYDAIILATAGLERMQLDNRIQSKLTADTDWLSAVGQGAVGVECLQSRKDLIELLSSLNHDVSSQCVVAERAMNKVLNGGCSVAIGAYAELVDDQLFMKAIVCAPDGSKVIREQAYGKDAEKLGIEIAEKLLAKGAKAILALADE